MPMITLDTQKFMEDGYLILRGLVPPDKLGPLQDTAEELVRRKWPEGMPQGSFQNWIHGFENSSLIDAQTANMVEFFMHENTLGVAHRLMPNAKAVAPAGVFLMCNAMEDHGPWFWHRDIDPETKGPLEGLQLDMKANGPVYLHFNVALQHDDIFWFVPGSHLRPNTEEENRQLLSVPHSYANGQQPMSEKRHTPLPNSVCADLEAGDAVINHLELLHWASNYGPELRRTLHLGYRSFDGPSCFYEGYSPGLEYEKYLSPSSRDVLNQCDELFNEELGNLERVLRAVLVRDKAAFKKALARYHPAEVGRFVALIHICKDVQQMHTQGNGDLVKRFAAQEIQTLWERFTPLDQALQADEPQNIPAFQIRGPSRYRLNEMPPNYDIDRFVAESCVNSN